MGCLNAEVLFFVLFFLLVAQAGAQSTVCYWQVVGSLRLLIGVYLISFDTFECQQCASFRVTQLYVVVFFVLHKYCLCCVAELFGCRV